MSWPLVKLSDVAQINPRCPKDIDGEQLVSFVAMASASEDGKLLSEEVKVLDETKKGFTYFERGDVLLAKITPCFENGKCLRPNQISKTVGFGSTEFHVLRAIEEKLDSSYLFYMVWSKAFRFLGEHSMSGAAGQKRVSADFLKAYEIPLPPLEEQKRIAAILDKADSVRRKRQQAIDLADDFLRSVFLDMFGDPSDYKTVKELLDEDYLLLHKDGNHGSNYPRKNEFVDSGVPFISAKDISDEDGTIDYGTIAYLTEQKAAKLTIGWLEKGDVLLAHNATVGRVGYFDGQVPEAIIGTSLTAFRVNPERMSSMYLFAALKYSKFQKQLTQNMGQSTRNQVPITAQKELHIPLGSMDKQIKFEKLLAQVMTQKSRLLSSSSGGEDLFNSLSQKAFAGEL